MQTAGGVKMNDKSLEDLKTMLEEDETNQKGR